MHHDSAVKFTVLIFLGEFGLVYRGTLSGWRGKGQELIAVKTLKGILMSTHNKGNIYINIFGRLL